jgi:hypothetical protein
MPNVNNNGIYELPEQIHNGADYNKCLGALNQGTADGTPLVIWDCNGNTDQLWKGIPVDANNPGEGFVIENVNAPNEVISIQGATDAPSTTAILWHEVVTWDQVWQAGRAVTIAVP